jgi:hypothetical protein
MKYAGPYILEHEDCEHSFTFKLTDKGRFNNLVITSHNPSVHNWVSVTTYTKLSKTAKGLLVARNDVDELRFGPNQSKYFTDILTSEGWIS